MRSKIYLAGPVTGLSFGASEGWRNAFSALVAGSPVSERVELFSPLRAKPYLRGEGAIAAQYEGTVLSSQRGIIGHAYWDVITSAALVIDFSGAENVSIGTVMEIAWAYERRIPIIAVVNAVHAHPMVLAAVTFPVKDLTEALRALEALFLP